MADEGPPRPASGPEPNPCPAALPPPGSGEPPFRRLNCMHYDDCLDLAIARHWESWGCTGCQAYRISPREQGLLDWIRSRGVGASGG